MGYYADLIKEKRNAKYSYNLVKKGEDKWVIQTKYGGKTVDEQEFYGTEEAAKRKGENNVRYFESRNSKEEKDNDKVVEKYTRNSAEIEILETESGNYRSRVHKGGTTKEITTTAKSISEARKDAEEYARTMGNEKEETEDKENASAEDSEKIKRQIVSVEAYLKDRLEWQKSVNKEVEGCQRELARLKKMLGNNNSKEEEKGYYAKLAEEKVSKKNAKSWRIEFLGNSYYIETLADCDRALGKARQVQYTKERELHDEITYVKEQMAKFGDELAKIEKEIASQKTK